MIPRREDKQCVPVPAVDINDLNVFQKRVEVVVDLYRKSGTLRNADIIGALEIIKMNLFMESCEDEDGDDWEGGLAT